MKKFTGYAEATTLTERPRLPLGGYILRIMDARELTYSWGSVLKVDFDIAEGEQKGFYQKDYDSQTQEDKKWKGSFRLNVPKDDGSEQDAWTKSRFKTVIEDAIEVSNAGYKWDWDETKLKGKVVGGIFNNKEWEMDGDSGYKSGFFTNCKSLISVEKIRSNDFTIPSDDLIPDNKRISKKPTSTDSGDGFMNIPDGGMDELPFGN